MYRIVEPKRKIYIEIGGKLDIVKSKLKKKEKQLRQVSVLSVFSEINDMVDIRQRQFILVYFLYTDW